MKVLKWGQSEKRIVEGTPDREVETVRDLITPYCRGRGCLGCYAEESDKSDRLDELDRSD